MGKEEKRNKMTDKLRVKLKEPTVAEIDQALLDKKEKKEQRMSGVRLSHDAGCDRRPATSAAYPLRYVRRRLKKRKPTTLRTLLLVSGRRRPRVAP